MACELCDDKGFIFTKATRNSPFGEQEPCPLCLARVKELEEENKRLRGGMTHDDLRVEFESWKDSLTVSSTPGFLRGLQAALSGMARRMNAIGLHMEIREYFDGLIAGESGVKPVAPPETPDYFGANRRELYKKSRR